MAPARRAGSKDSSSNKPSRSLSHHSSSRPVGKRKTIAKAKSMALNLFSHQSSAQRIQRAISTRLHSPRIKDMLLTEKLHQLILTEVVTFWTQHRPHRERPLDAFRRNAVWIAQCKNQEAILRHQVTELRMHEREEVERKGEELARAQREQLGERRECMRQVFTNYHTFQRPTTPGVGGRQHSPGKWERTSAAATTAQRMTRSGGAGTQSMPDLAQPHIATAWKLPSVPRAFSPECSPPLWTPGEDTAEEPPPTPPADGQASGKAPGKQQRRSRAFHKLISLSEATSQKPEPVSEQACTADFPTGASWRRPPRPGGRNLGKLARQLPPEAPRLARRPASAGSLGSRASSQPAASKVASACGRQSALGSTWRSGLCSPEADSISVARQAELGATWHQGLSSPSPGSPLGAAQGRLEFTWPGVSPYPQSPGVSEILREADTGSRTISRSSVTTALDTSGQATEQALTFYLRECNDVGISPKPIPFITGHSQKLISMSGSLVDSDLLALSASLGRSSVLEEVDLDGSSLLTDSSLVPFLQKLVALPGTRSCTQLSFRHCRSAGMATLDALTRALESPRGLQVLRRLELSGVPVPSRCRMALCRAVRSHTSLRSLGLAEVGLGQIGVAEGCIRDLMANSSLEELDLGWNRLTSELLVLLGQCLVESSRSRQEGSLKSISLSNCGVVTTWDAPILFFIEQLSQDSGLTSLDVSLNRIDHSGALVLEDALESHEALATVNVSHNPLGALGMRCMLRLLFCDGSGLTCFQSDHCDSHADNVDQSGYGAFKKATPDGDYALELARPSHRAILRLLYKISRRNDVLAPQDVFFDVTYSGTPSAAKVGNPTREWSLPCEGRLDFTFGLDGELAGRKVRQCSKGGPSSSPEEEEAFCTILERHWQLTRTKLGSLKEGAFSTLWEGLDIGGKMTVLDALSQDFLLTYAQLTLLCRNRSHSVDVLRRLLHRVEGGVKARYLAMTHVPTLRDYLQVTQHVLAKYFLFNVENATGHYKLALDDHSEFAIAETLLLLSRWEAKTAQARKKKDVSQLGDWAHVRNVHYQGHLVSRSVQRWSIPNVDTLELDYVAGRRLSPDCQVLDRACFDVIMRRLQMSKLDMPTQINVLRRVSDQLCIEAMQLREMLGSFASTDSDRAEIFVMLFFRVVDIHNEKVFRVRFSNQEELVSLRKRLGYMVTFPFIQPENARFELDLRHNDERLCANVLLKLAAKEGTDNVRGPMLEDRRPVYKLDDGSVDSLAAGIPRSWETFEKMPAKGTLACSYLCGPEHRDYKLRVHCLRTYGHWDTNAPEADVKWWAALVDVPSDVIAFLEFLVSHFDDMDQAFRAVDLNHRGQVTLNDFEIAVRKMGCKKFQTTAVAPLLRAAEEKMRITNVFRYLDVDGGGNISSPEWSVLTCIWKEMRCSITEFVQFLERHFTQTLRADENDNAEHEADFSHHGPLSSLRKKAANIDCADVLELAWEKLDEDGSGTVDADEWVGAVKNNLHYFGPCEIIFKFIDADDGGDVSWDEFKRLEVFLRGGSAKHLKRQTVKSLIQVPKPMKSSGSTVGSRNPSKNAAQNSSRGRRSNDITPQGLAEMLQKADGVRGQTSARRSGSKDKPTSSARRRNSDHGPVPSAAAFTISVEMPTSLPPPEIPQTGQPAQTGRSGASDSFASSDEEGLSALVTEPSNDGPPPGAPVIMVTPAS